MLKDHLFRFAIAASLLALTSSWATAQEGGRPQPAPGAEFDASPSVAPDPLAPPDAKEPAPIAPGAPVTPSAEANPSQDLEPIAAQIRARLGSAGGRADNRDDVTGLGAFYAERNGEPIWTDRDGLNQRASRTIAEIRKAGDWGLDASAFALPEPPAGQAAPEVLADAELKLSLAVLKYARYARGGRIDLSAATDLIDVAPRIFQPKSVLQAIAAAERPGAYLRGLHPKHEQFERLRQALLALDKEAPEAPKAKIPAGQIVRPGERNAQVTLVRQRLAVTASDGDEAVYDAPLIEAVKKYQREHGLDATGVIDRRLRASLNAAVSDNPSEKRQRIVANMERWRWLPDNLGEFYVWDSIPEQLTRVYDHGKLVLMEKIVVGKPSSPTPTFSARMQFVIFHPEWGVPDSIKVKELAPKLRRASSNYGGDEGFPFFGGGGFGGRGGSSEVLARWGLRVSVNGHPVDPDSVDWSSVDIRRYQFIQPSGGRNALGIVKFRFPNKHDVYMHDTPDKQFFNETTRTFSHGCMRTQNPIHLAEVILGHDKGLPAEEVRQLANEGGGSPNEITLTNPVPVHVTYFTMDVGDDGKLRTHPDIYGIDNKVMAALKGQPLVFSLKSSGAQAMDDSGDGQPPRMRRERPRQWGEGWGDERRAGPPRGWGPFGDLFDR